MVPTHSRATVRLGHSGVHAGLCRITGQKLFDRHLKLTQLGDALLDFTIPSQSRSNAVDSGAQQLQGAPPRASLEKGDRRGNPLRRGRG